MTSETDETRGYEFLRMAEKAGLISKNKIEWIRIKPESKKEEEEDTIDYFGKVLHLVVKLDEQPRDRHLDRAQEYLDDAREMGLAAACTHHGSYTKVYRERRQK